jgi:hypothetical protein
MGLCVLMAFSAALGVFQIKDAKLITFFLGAYLFLFAVLLFLYEVRPCNAITVHRYLLLQFDTRTFVRACLLLHRLARYIYIYIYIYIYTYNNLMAHAQTIAL